MDKSITIIKPNHRRKFFLLSILLIFSLVFLQVSYAADPPLPTPVGRVVWVKGTLKAVMPNNEERSLQKMSVIYINDTLMTDSESQAQIVFTDNTLMTFKQNTKFRIDEYSFNPKGKKGSIGKYVMELIEGGFRTITGLIAKDDPEDYKINTPVATIGVRGTDYAVYIDHGKLLMNYYSGTPCLTSGGGSLCLTDKVRYASVPAAGALPVALAQQPAVFQEKLPVVPAKIETFTAPSGLTGSGGESGTVSSFCITN